MRYSVVVNILVGMVGMIVVGCGNFGLVPPQETRNEYSKFVEGKMGEFLDAHARLVVQAQQRGFESKRQINLDATLDGLTKKGKRFKGESRP